MTNIADFAQEPVGPLVPRSLQIMAFFRPLIGQYGFRFGVILLCWALNGADDDFFENKGVKNLAVEQGNDHV